jgi:23S rRNA (cytosine1962-C5)-methyltransferase
MSMSAELYLKKDCDRRLRAGHCWIYSNEVDPVRTAIAALQPAADVAVFNHGGRWLGWAYANPHSLICGRLMSRDRSRLPDRSWVVHRLKIALGLRERLYREPYYRLVYGETDGLPGLIVDRYGAVLVAQLTTAGMEARRVAVVEALDKVLRPRAILLRNDTVARELEGLSRYVEIAQGEVGETALVREGNAQFKVSLSAGQKTGWYYDQAANRGRLAPYVAGKRVLDVCSYVGAWGIRAAKAGAAEVLCVDASQTAIEGALDNAARNQVADRVSARRGDAFVCLKELKSAGKRFDVVVLDPPAFVKRRKDLREGVLAYRRLNQTAINLVKQDGILVTASCSYHMGRDNLLRTVQQAARHVDRSLQLLEYGQQGPDHPVHPAIAETAYLKALFLRVLAAF